MGGDVCFWHGVILNQWRLCVFGETYWRNKPYALWWGQDGWMESHLIGGAVCVCLALSHTGLVDAVVRWSQVQETVCFLEWCHVLWWGQKEWMESHLIGGAVCFLA